MTKQINTQNQWAQYVRRAGLSWGHGRFVRPRDWTPGFSCAGFGSAAGMTPLKHAVRQGMVTVGPAMARALKDAPYWDGTR